MRFAPQYDRYMHQDPWLFQFQSPEKIVQCITSCTGPHFLGTGCHRIDICPPAFWSFSIHLTNTVLEVEQEHCLTFLNVGKEVKFWDEEGDSLPYEIEVHWKREPTHMLPEFFVPLAGDVIWNVESCQGGVTECWKKKVVHVNVSTNEYLSVHVNNNDWVESLLSLLKVSNSIWMLHVVTCTVDSAKPSGCQPSTSLCIRHIDGVMAGARRFLEGINERQMQSEGNLTSWGISILSLRNCLYTPSSTKYAHLWLNPGSVVLFDPTFHLRRKFTLMAMNNPRLPC